MIKVRDCKALARRTLLGRYGTVIGAYFVSSLIQLIVWLLVGAGVVFTVYNAGLLNTFLPFNIVFSFPKVVIGVMASLALFIAACIVSLWFEIGSTKLMLNICRGMKYGIGDVFYGFKSGSNTISYVFAGFALMLVFAAVNTVQRTLFFVSSFFVGEHTYLSILVTAIISLLCMFATYYLATMFMFAKLIIADKPDNTVGSAFSKSRELMKGRKLKGFWLMYLSFFFWYLLMFFCCVSMLWIAPYISCTMIIFYMDADNTLWQLPDSGNVPPAGSSHDGTVPPQQTYSETSDTSAAANVETYPDAEQQGTAYSDTDEHGCDTKAASYGTSYEDNSQTDESTHSTEQDVAHDDNTVSAGDAGASSQAENEVSDGVHTDDTFSDNTLPEEGTGSSDNKETKQDSWEQTVAEMNIDIPAGFGKAGE